MAEFPGFTIWTDAYFGDTRHLGMMEHGAYLQLLLVMWRAGGYLPNDDNLLARYASGTPAQWAKVKPVVMPFFVVENDKITQPRLLDELEKARERSRKQSENSRAKYRKLKDLANPAGDPKRVPNASQNDPSTSISTDTGKSSLRSDSAPAKPTPRQELLKVLDADRAEAVIEHRQRIRKPITAHAAKILAGKLAKWHDANEAADAMISNGWQGFEVEWMSRARGSPAGGGKSAFRQHQDEVTQSFRDALKGTQYDQSPHDDRQGQPSFDLESGDFFSDRTASAGKR